MDIYQLCEYGVTLNTVKKLIDADINLLDIKLLRESILTRVFREKSSYVEQILSAIDKVRLNDNYKSIYVLAAYDISGSILDRLHSANVTLYDIVNLSYDDIKKIVFLQEAMFKKIVKFTWDALAYSSIKKQRDYSLYLLGIIKKFPEEISIVGLKNYLIENTFYPTENLTEELKKLQAEDLIEYTMNGVREKRITLEYYIDKLLKKEYKDVIKMRFSGMTLEETGSVKGITRERVRQIVASVVKKMPPLFEDKYREFFEDYSFSEAEFCNIFEVNKDVYYYLKEKYSLGSISLDNVLDDSRFTMAQKSKIEKMYKIETIFGKKIFINKNSILKVLVEEYLKDGMRIEEFCSIYNNFITSNNYDIEMIDERSLEGILGRTNSVLFGYGRMIRFYSIDFLGEDDLQKIEQLYDLEDGYYSTLVLFENNKELMAELDIRNEYELHNFSKNYLKNINHISFDRMPNFSVNGVLKEDFMFDKIRELSPISANDFCIELEKNYGHKYSTMITYVPVLFQNFMTGTLINFDQVLLGNQEIEKLKTILNKPIYTISELKDIFKTNDIGNYDEVINGRNMHELGYKIRSSYVLRNDISTIEEYIKSLTSTQNFIRNDNFLLNSTYFTMMKRIEKNFDMIFISNKEYITIKKLNELGIFKDDILNFCYSVKENFCDEEYFTLNNIREKIIIEKLDDFGFNDIFLESIISNIDGVYTLKISGSRVFSMKNDINVKNFVLDMIGGRTGVLLDELKDEIFDKFGLNVEIEKLKSVIINTELYYNEFLNKVYQNKDYYYEEVYSYE